MFKKGGGVIDTSCQRSSEMLYETIAISLFHSSFDARTTSGLRYRLLTCTPYAYWFCILPYRLSRKQETAQSLVFSRSFNCCYGNLLHHENDNQVFTNDNLVLVSNIKEWL